MRVTSETEQQSSGRDLILVHSSDLHVDDDRIAANHGGDGAAGLRDVLTTARRLNADLVLLAGDTFDNHMVCSATIDRAGQVLAEAGLPVVILPGNHDPVMSGSVWAQGGFGDIPGLRILGMTDDEIIEFPQFELEIWGRAHRDYLDMAPLADPPPRQARRHIVMAHGHYEPPESWANPLRPSWLISDDHIAATAADYLALGHWDRAAQVGCGAVPAYYSGSPEYVHTVNLVRLTPAGETVVTRERLVDNQG